MKRTRKRKFITHKQKFEDYIKFLEETKGLQDFGITMTGEIDEEFYKVLLKTFKDADNPDKYEIITDL